VLFTSELLWKQQVKEEEEEEERRQQRRVVQKGKAKDQCCKVFF
jgi:hypothetical protein